MMTHFLCGALLSIGLATGAENLPTKPLRCELVSLPGAEISFLIDGVERLTWHGGSDVPRPFFFPLIGPSGEPLTRMGHPGAPDHDHHRSIWFAHHDIEGHSFWTEETEARIRQKQWLAMESGEEEARLGTLLGWYDPEGIELLEQELVVAVRPLPEGEMTVELQSTWRLPEGRESTRLEKTNFGLLAVRMAASISARFGAGRLLDSEGREGEKAIFGQQAVWMDYSGPVAVGQGEERHWVEEGVAFLDHPQNPRYPTHWHVRDDGWMGASYCFADGETITPEKPLVLRYLLYVHNGRDASAAITKENEAFAARPGFIVAPGSASHVKFEISRAK